jgi:type I restriction-modification system DNA methylase subunit
MNHKSTPETSTANFGFEQRPWLAADKLRNNMDAAEYKHVVLGLIFLKYISDSFEARPPLDIEQTHRLIAKYVNYDNTVRLHSAIGKLAQARRQRKIKRQNQPAHSLVPQPNFSN